MNDKQHQTFRLNLGCSRDAGGKGGYSEKLPCTILGFGLDLDCSMLKNSLHDGKAEIKRPLSAGRRVSAAITRPSGRRSSHFQQGKALQL